MAGSSQVLFSLTVSGSMGTLSISLQSIQTLTLRTSCTLFYPNSAILVSIVCECSSLGIELVSLSVALFLI